MNKCLGTIECSVLQIVALCGLGPGSGDLVEAQVPQLG